MVKEKLYYGWFIVAACFILGFVTHGIRFSFGIFFKPLETDLSLSRALTSDIFSLYMILCSIFAIIAGWALDRYQPKAIVATMGFLTGMSLLLSSYANTLWHLLLTYSLLLAAGTGPAYAVVMPLTSRWFTIRRGLALGIVSCGISIGIMCISPLSAWFVNNLGWQTSYFILALIAFFTMTPVAFLLKKAPSEVSRLINNGKLDSIKTDNYQQEFSRQIDGLSLPDAVKTKAFWLLLLLQFFFASCIFIIIAHIVPYAIDLGIAPVQASTILSIIGGISIPGTLLMGSLSDNIGRKPVIVICALLMIVSMICLMSVSNSWILYLFAVIFGFTRGGLSPLFAALTSDTFGLRHIGIIMGVTIIGWFLGAAVGPAFAGYIFDINGSYDIAFLAGVIAVMIGALMTVFVRVPRSNT